MFHPGQIYRPDIFLSYLVMFMHKLLNSSHTNTDITPLLCSLSLNIYLLQFILEIATGRCKELPFPSPMGEAAAFSKASTYPGESGDNPFHRETNKGHHHCHPWASLLTLQVPESPGTSMDHSKKREKNLHLFSRATGSGMRGPTPRNGQFPVSPAQAWARISACALLSRSQRCQRGWPEDSTRGTPLAH